MTRVSPVTAGLRLPYRIHDGIEPTSGDAAELAEYAVELAVYLWCDYQDTFVLDPVRIAFRPDLSRDEFTDLAVELCEISIEIDLNRLMGAQRSADALCDDFARHLAKMTTAPAAVSE